MLQQNENPQKANKVYEIGSWGSDGDAYVNDGSGRKITASVPNLDAKSFPALAKTSILSPQPQNRATRYSFGEQPVGPVPSTTRLPTRLPYEPNAAPQIDQS